jgi:phosphoribosyl 1,2-cyclic phosphodiesterase
VRVKGICPLASGSKGNCIYVGTKEAKILIDVGISYRMLQKRLSEIDVKVEEIDAVVITHEHSDHISGLPLLTEKHKMPIFANRETASGIYELLKISPKFKIFTTAEPFEFLDLVIHPFSIPHDCLDPVGLVIQMDNYKAGFCTDLGYVTTMVRKVLKDCDYLYLEANHQPSMVHASSRPLVYKQRVLGRQGHLSNESCADLLSSVYHEKLKAVYLAHLSSECNSKELALKIVSEYLEKKQQKVKLMIAHQDAISEAVTFT